MHLTASLPTTLIVSGHKCVLALSKSSLAIGMHFNWTKLLVYSKTITLNKETFLSIKEAEQIVRNLENGKNKFDGRDITWVKCKIYTTRIQY